MNTFGTAEKLSPFWALIKRVFDEVDYVHSNFPYTK